ncbi:MAG: TetR family transcriptional regulator [Parasporobacterium sp.]|nr:TetR family transcriptional regulator [Parasporobacterium sp.]
MANEFKKAGNARREEIMAVCEQLYENTSIKDITVRDIGKETSVGRTSFYTYFKTKDEIFLAILAREYESWAEDLRNLTKLSKAILKEDLAQAIADTLEGRSLFLKILSENPFDMEKNCREDCLEVYHNAYIDVLDAISEVLEKFSPQMTAADRQEFIYAFLPFLHGIYPYTEQHDKQAAAMKEAGFAPANQTASDLAYAFLCVLLI